MDYSCNTIGASYRYVVDKKEKNYYSLRLHWNYKFKYAGIAIRKVIPSILKKLNYSPKVSLQHSPHCHIPIQYGKKEY